MWQSWWSKLFGSSPYVIAPLRAIFQGQAPQAAYKHTGCPAKTSFLPMFESRKQELLNFFILKKYPYFFMPIFFQTPFCLKLRCCQRPTHSARARAHFLLLPKKLSRPSFYLPIAIFCLIVLFLFHFFFIIFSKLLLQLIGMNQK